MRMHWCRPTRSAFSHRIAHCQSNQINNDVTTEYLNWRWQRGRPCQTYDINRLANDLPWLKFYSLLIRMDFSPLLFKKNHPLNVVMLRWARAKSSNRDLAVSWKPVDLVILYRRLDCNFIENQIHWDLLSRIQRRSQSTTDTIIFFLRRSHFASIFFFFFLFRLMNE